MFTVERPAALTNLPLTVNYTASGTASNGVDYVLIPNSIVIPAGATTNTITIVPIMDGVYDVPDKQVTLTLAPGAYAIGTPSSDTVTIQDVAPSTANTWTGTGNWTNAANWSDAIPPLPGQRVVIQGTTTLATASVALGPVTIVSNFTLIFSGTNSVLTATDVTISGTVTHVANSTVTTNQFGQWVADARVCIVCTNLTIAASGKIDVIGKGYGGGGSRTNGFGPSGGLFVTYGMGAGGGGYGGRGGFLANRGTQAVAYGSAALPTQPGSGGGGDSGYSGGGGGGLVWLAVAANATVNGAIIVDGAKGGQICGSGSGGSLYLSAQTLLGNGSITAKGGDGDAQYGSGGGGGRLALYAGDASAWAGRIDVSPGWTHTLAPLTPAQVGTVYALNTSLLRESFTNQQWRLYGVVAWAPGQLTVSSNAYLSFEDTALTLTVGSNMTVTGASYLGLGAGMLSNAGPFSVGGNLVVQGASTLAIGATNALTNAVAFSVAGNLTVQGASALSIGVANTLPQTAALAVAGDMMLSNGASLTVYSGPTNGATPYGYGALVSVVGNILLASNSWIYPYSHGTNGGSPIFRMRDLTILTNAGFNANGAGFAGGLSTGFGPGFGSKGADLLSGGASHGGPGGRGYWSAYLGTVGPTNGSMQTPTSPGSGAGGYSTVPGGAGGGLVRIEAAHLLTINGTITANGQNGTATPTAGGAGGAIYIRCGTLAGDSAILSANGGSYGDYGSSILAGAGGGGRIAVWRVGTTANTNTWSVTANGGAGKTGFDPVAGAAGSVFWGALPPPGTVFLMQ